VAESKRATGHKDWTREEHVLALNLYSKILFGSIGMRNPKIIELAKILGRSVGAVSYKMANFARLDRDLQARGIKGMLHGAGGEEDVWREFEDNPEAFSFESQRLFAQFTGRKLEEIAEIDERDLPTEGLEREQMVRIRVNQHFFRAAVLSAYDNKCCITGLAVPELLVASHITPWAVDSKQRMNPRNGLCLNALHDRAFDRGLMFIAEDWTVHFCKELKSANTDKNSGLLWLLQFENKPIILPKKFLPDFGLLTKHREHCKQRGNIIYC
jgi:putative restriction endonuclease